MNNQCPHPERCASIPELPRKKQWNESRTSKYNGGDGTGYVWPCTNGRVMRTIDNIFDNRCSDRYRVSIDGGALCESANED